MKKIIGTRGIGKTRSLLQYAQDNEAIVLSLNAKRLKEKASYYGMDFSNIVELSKENLFTCMKLDKKFVIDDLDAALPFVFGKSFCGYTLSID